MGDTESLRPPLTSSCYRLVDSWKLDKRFWGLRKVIGISFVSIRVTLWGVDAAECQPFYAIPTLRIKRLRAIFTIESRKNIC
jgi:hypothetical protein